MATLKTKATAIEPVPLPRRRRDVRVDRIGFVGELVKHWIEADTTGDKAKGLKARVKADVGPGEVLEGDFFEASVVGSTETELSASAVVKLHKQGAISEAELVEMIGVKLEPAKKILPPKTLARISRRYEGTPRLNVKRKGGVEVSLQQAVAGVGQELLRAAA